MSLRFEAGDTGVGVGKITEGGRAENWGAKARILNSAGAKARQLLPGSIHLLFLC